MAQQVPANFNPEEADNLEDVSFSLRKCYEVLAKLTRNALADQVEKQFAVKGR